MDLELSPRRYQIDIPQGIWLEFFVQLTQDNRGRLITLKLLDNQPGNFDLLCHKPLFSVIYERPNYGNDLVVTVSRAWAIAKPPMPTALSIPSSLALRRTKTA